MVPTVVQTVILAAAALALTLADLRKTVTVSSPRIAPDGTRIAVSVSRPDFSNDRALTNLVLVSVKTHAARTLLYDVRDLGTVEWSPDGTRIAYVAQAEDPKGTDQLFLLPMDGGEPRQLTHEKKGVDDLDWRPDGRAIAYSVETQPPNEKAIKDHADEFEVTDEPWTAQSAPTRVDLYQIEANGTHPRRIGSGSWSVGGGFTYAFDGRSIFVTRISGDQLPTRYLAREIVRIDLRTGRMTPLPRLSRTQSDPLRGPDGRIAFAFTNPHGSMQLETALAQSDGSHPVFVTDRLDRNVGAASFLPGDVLVLDANDGTRNRLFRVTPAGAVSILPTGDTGAQDGQSTSRNGTVAFAGDAPDRPPELYLLPPDARAPIRLTNYNGWIDRYRLGKPVTVSWRTFDGLTADGVVLTPPHPRRGTRAPLVLYIHGGPTSASTVDYSSIPQILATHGWYVFEPNYRGSDNLGLTFARTTVPHITSVPGRDIEDGLRRVLAHFPVDPRRIGVSGWSEGGLMTSWLITHDTRWAAAVDGAAVDDWVLYHDLTDAKDFSPQFIGRSPWSSAAQFRLYEHESPLTYAQNVRTPTLIMSDAGDFRVPTPLDYEFYHAIRATGTPVQFVVYPVVGHFPRDPVRVEDIVRRWEGWLARYLR
jgi:dipeptidyl aminopeptidase/acylaminoacyl peptidase